jgi:hypothetical protein
MYEKEKKNINTLLKHIEIPGIIDWSVDNLCNMEFEGEIRLELMVIYDSYYLSTIYRRTYDDFDTIVQDTFRILKHYVHSFLGLTIGEVKINTIKTYERVSPKFYYY